MSDGREIGAPSRRESANQYLAGMAARGFVVSEEKLRQLRDEVAAEEGDMAARAKRAKP